MNGNFSDFVVNARKEPVCGIPVRHAKLARYIPFSKKMYFVFMGFSGSGKTACVDGTFLIDPYDTMKKMNMPTTDIKWVYRSMERPEEYKRAKWVAYKIFKDHKILIDVPTILNFTNKSRDLTDDDIDLIKSYDDYFNELNEHLYFIGGNDTTQGILNTAINIANKYGKLHKTEHGVYYEPDNPNRIVIHITDFLQKIKRSSGQTKKTVIDDHSLNMAAILRDVYGWLVVDVAQTNRALGNAARFNPDQAHDIGPEDLKDSSDPYDHADVVLGLVNPNKLGFNNYLGYNIPKTINAAGYSRFRGIKIVKNSYGADDVAMGYAFAGECGFLTELPHHSHMTDDLYTKVKEMNIPKDYIF